MSMTEQTHEEYKKKEEAKSTPIIHKRLEPTVKPPKKDRFDVTTVLFFVYLLYKCNMLTRHNIRQMFKIIKGETPDDVAKYLAEEEKKGT